MSGRLSLFRVASATSVNFPVALLCQQLSTFKPALSTKGASRTAPHISRPLLAQAHYESPHSPHIPAMDTSKGNPLPFFA